jgi:hypothetical protein
MTLRSIMTSRPVRFLAVISLAFSLSGCANIQDDTQRTKVEGTGGGAIIGAIIGGGLAALAGGGGNSIARGAMIGGAAGALLGNAYANHVVAKKKAYASEEAWLDSCIASAKASNANAVAHNQKLATQIAQLKQQISGAKAAHDKVAMRNAVATIAKLQQETTNQNKALTKEIGAQNYALKQPLATDAGRARAAGVSNQIANMKSTQSTLNNNSKLLADLATSATF